MCLNSSSLYFYIFNAYKLLFRVWFMLFLFVLLFFKVQIAFQQLRYLREKNSSVYHLH